MSAILQALLGELNLKPDNDISNVASSFTDVVKGYMRTIQDAGTMKNIDQETETLTKIYAVFYEYSVKWAAVEREKYARVKNHAEAARLKQQAAGALKELQQNIVRFARAYAHLGRCMGVVHAAIVKTPKTADAEKKFKWTSDTGVVLRRYQKERKALKEANAKLTEALAILEAAEAHVEGLYTSLEKLHGKKDAEQYLTSLRSRLRVGDFAKAKKILASLGEEKKKALFGKSPDPALVKDIQSAGAAFIGALEKAQNNLQTGDGKLFLSAREVSVVLSSQEREIEQKTKYIDKYHLPYMESKLRALETLRDKLLIVGSLESLTTLYMRLMRGMAQPMVDIKEVRNYEAEVIENVSYLLSGQFQEIANTEKWMGATMDEFYECMADFDD